MKLPELRSRRTDKALNSAGGNLKVPKFLADLYADLRDRRLLPLVVLLVVAIAAAPFLLKSKGESEETPEVAAIPAVAAGSTQSGFAVTPAARQLRAYGGRLGYRKARNPFLTHGAPSGQGKSEGEGGGVERSGSSSEGEASTGAEVTPESERVIVEPKVIKATLKAQVGVAAVVKAGYVGSKPKRLELEAQTRLPQKSPAVVYTGTSKKGGALFLMTGEVSEFSGDGHCTLGGATCQIVELLPKKSETFRIGYGETRLKIYLLGYEPIVKEKVVEVEGKKIRVPNQKHDGSGSGRAGQGSGTVGSEPAPRWMLR